MPEARAYTKTEVAYLDLRARILDGEIGPDEVIDQGVVAQDLGISTTPVREALRRLEAEQLVIMAAHRDARVAPLPVEQLKNLYVVRMELDPLAAELAAEAASDDEIAAVVAILAGDAGTPEERFARNSDFHRAIYRACGNPILVRILDQLWGHSERYRRVLVQIGEEVDRAQRDHREILRALQQRNGPYLGRLVRRHLEHSYDEIGRITEADDR